MRMGNGSESSVPVAYSAKSKAAPALFLIREGGMVRGWWRRRAQGAALGWYGPCRERGYRIAVDCPRREGAPCGWLRGREWVEGGGDDLTAGIAYVDR